MKTTIASILVLLQAMGISAQQPSYGCGQPSSRFASTRIIGGSKAKPYTWPWQVSIAEGGQHFCGGSILRTASNVEQSDLILTAAHCVLDGRGALYPFANWNVLAGTNSKIRKSFLNSGEEIRRVIRVAPHRQFGYADGLAHDIAILQLDRPIRFSDYIRPVCLPAMNDPLPLDRTCVVTGWGRNDSKTNQSPDDLQQAPAPVHNLESCQKKWSWTGNTWRTAYICASPADSSSTSCQGDSGGPLVCRNTDGTWSQQGVVSHGTNDCKPDKLPPVYARVASYVNWISQIMTELGRMPRGLVEELKEEAHLNDE